MNAVECSEELAHTAGEYTGKGSELRKTAFYDKVTLLIISLIGQYSFCDKAIGAFLISALPMPQVGLDSLIFEPDTSLIAGLPAVS